MDAKLLDIIACPVCKGKMSYSSDNEELVCRFDRLAFPVKEGIPLMLASQAREITSDELDALK
jgi:hypothetical protein